MRKMIAALVLAALCLTAAAGTGAAAAEEEKAPSLYDRGLEVVQVLSEMAQSEEWVGMFTDEDQIRSAVQDVAGGDYSTPKAVYTLSVADEELERLAALGGLGGLSDELKAFLLQRMMGSLMNRANSLDGAETLAAANICTYAKTFVDESAEGDVIYLYTYEDAAPVAVTFTLGEDHTVTANGTFVLCDGFACGSAEEIADFFDYITVDVAQVPAEE